MGKADWIESAAKLLEPYQFANPTEYAESLYETYVEQDDPDCSPEDAVNEDITYWGD